MSSPFSILYLEDDYQDVRILTKTIQSIFAEYGEQELVQLDTMEKVSKYLDAKGIEWVENYAQLQNCLEQNKMQEYKLFLIDMKMKGEASVRGWEIIEKIREKRGDQASPIWILSNYSFFEKPAEKEYGIQHFFTKNEAGYDRLKRELMEWFLPVKSRPQEQYLEFLNSSDQIEQVPVSEIVSIEIKNREHFLYRLDPNGFKAHRNGYPPHRFFDATLKQIQEKGIRDLVQISYGMIINIKMVESIQGSGKKYCVWLSQRGENQPLSVSYQYLKKLKEIYGDPLPLVQ